MSTILPLETVFGRSTWSLTTSTIRVIRAFDPSALFGIKFLEEVAPSISTRFPYADYHRYQDPFNPSLFERLPHSEGPLGTGWVEHFEFTRTSGMNWYNDTQNNHLKNMYIMDRYSEDGLFPLAEWGAPTVIGYRAIHPFALDSDGTTYVRPFESSDITAPYEEVFLTGECGNGEGSERPESGLLYPRKV